MFEKNGLIKESFIIIKGANKLTEMKPAIVFVYRENFKEDSELLIQLLNLINREEYDVYFESIDTTDWEIKSSIIFEGLKILLKNTLIWCCLKAFYHSYLNTPQKSIDKRAKKIVKFLSGFSPTTEITLISRSAGGIVCAHVCKRLKIKQVICLGYPFFHPNLGEQTYRTKPLLNLNTQFTIFQGRHDVYGGANLKLRADYFSKVKIYFLETNHDFEMDYNAWNEFQDLFIKQL